MTLKISRKVDKQKLRQRIQVIFCRIDTAVWLHYMDANKTAGEEAKRQLHKNATRNLEQVLAATPHKTPTVRPPSSYHEKYSS